MDRGRELLGAILLRVGETFIHVLFNSDIAQHAIELGQVLRGGDVVRRDFVEIMFLDHVLRVT